MAARGGSDCDGEDNGAKSAAKVESTEEASEGKGPEVEDHKMEAATNDAARGITEDVSEVVSDREPEGAPHQDSESNKETE